MAAALLNPVPPTRQELDRANEGTLATGAYFEALFEQRRREPRDDLLTLLVQAEEAGDRLDREQRQRHAAVCRRTRNDREPYWQWHLVAAWQLAVGNDPGQSVADPERNGRNSAL